MRRGLCKPDKIYVKDIVVQKDHVDKKESAASENATSGDRFNRLQEVEKTEVMNSEIHITQGSKNRCQEIGKTDTTNNDNIKTYNIKTDKSNQDNNNYHSIKGSALTEDDDTYASYEQLVKQQIEYEYAVKECQKNEVAYINAMVAIIAKLFCWPGKPVRINGVEYPYAYVKKKLLLITKDHIMYVVEQLRKWRPDISNIYNYLLVCMLRAVDTIDSYYTAQVNHDMNTGNFADEPDVSDKGQENEELLPWMR